MKGERRAREKRFNVAWNDGGGSGKHESFKFLLCICPHKNGQTDRRMDVCSCLYLHFHDSKKICEVDTSFKFVLTCSCLILL